MDEFELAYRADAAVAAGPEIFYRALRSWLLRRAFYWDLPLADVD